MRRCRSLPRFLPVTVGEWLNGSSRKTFAVVGCWAFGVEIDPVTHRLRRIDSYDRPDRIPESSYLTDCLPSMPLPAFLSRWQELWAVKFTITWDMSVLESQTANTSTI